MKEKIKVLLTRDGELSPKRVNENYIKNNHEDLYNDLITLYPEYTDIKEKIRAVINDGYNKCICGKIIPFKRKTCCKKCTYDLANKTREETLLREHGVVNVFQLQEVKDKTKETCIEKYGTEHHLQNPDILAKQQETNMELYGDICSLNNPDIKLKKELTIKERYGNENYHQSEHYRELINKKKFDYVELVTGIKRDEMDEDLIERVIRFITPNRSEDFVRSIINNDINLDIILSEDTIREQQKRTIAKGCGYSFDVISMGHQEVINYVKSIYDGEIIINDRKQLNPLELDIFIPEFNLAIEFNGTYWHSLKDRNYHQNKSIKAMDKGIKIIHIWEYNFDNKKDIYFNIIANSLQLSKRIYARKCVIGDVDKQVEKKFLNDNHIQGFTPSSNSKGLYYEGELVMVVSWGRSRFDKNYDYELLRVATKIGYNVVGGASRLIKLIEGSLISYCSLDYSNGNVYNKIGGEFIGYTKPSYVWANKKGYLNRGQTQSKKLGGNEDEIMMGQGFLKIYNAGNMKYRIK